MWLAIAFVFILCSYVFNSIFWTIMSGLLAIAAGVEFLDRSTEWTYLIFGTAVIVVGFYQLIMSAVDLIEMRKGE